MLLSKLLGERFKEKPADAYMVSHIFLLRGGYIRQVSNGIFSMLTPAKLVSQKIEAIIREEMNAIDGQEVTLPVVMPAELWQESGRFNSVGNELLRFKDRNKRDMLLGMTHEEAAVHLARTEAKSYLKYPFMIYQIQTKFRDELRARGGLIRVREFTMKDAYSFHTSQSDLESYYESVYNAYNNIFSRAGLKNVIAINSDSGMMGGQTAHEFMYLSDDGEDTIVTCDNCGYKSNLEVAVSAIKKETSEQTEISKVHTPNIKDIDSLAKFLGVKPSQTMKATVFLREDNQKPLVVFIRGDLQVNEAKLKKHVKSGIFPLNAYEDSPICFGFIGALGLPEADIEIVYDKSLQDEVNLVCGANETDYHLKSISVPRDLNIKNYADVAKANDGDYCSNCGHELKTKNGIEVGNIFQLGTKYSSSMNMSFMDSNGQMQTPIMGCYGIGIGRLLACVIEENHDEFGPVWPKKIAPWQIHICILNSEIQTVRETGFNIYDALKKDFEVILDDRNAPAGVQFADADLLGVPLRIIVSKRNLQNNAVEIVSRDKTLKKTVSLDSLNEEIHKLYSVL